MDSVSRRRFLAGVGASGAGFLLAGCGKKEESKEVTAIEDLMREHGPGALQKTAKLFRDFGEEYHEKKLEEAYIFPAVRQAGGEAARYPDILIAQHQRGREVTDYILSLSLAKLGAGKAGTLAQALESFVRMYRAHAAREDTIVFPAWKQALTAKRLDELNDKFEEIEHQQFGEDGFEKAVRRISEIESELGLADLARFTAPHPPPG